MKFFFLVFFLIFLISNSNSKELYCKKGNTFSSFPDPKIMNPSEYYEFKYYLENHHFPQNKINTCLPEIYPEVLELYKEIKNNTHGPARFKFQSSMFATEILANIKNTYDFEWNDLSNPFDVYLFVEYLKTNPQSPLPRVPVTITYNKMELKMLALNFNSHKKEEKSKHERALQEKNREEEQEEKQKIEKRSESLIREQYISSVVELRDLVFNELGNYIKNGWAKDENEFRQRVLLTCYEIDCPEKLKDFFLTKNNGDVDFWQFGSKPLSYLVKYNKLNELKRHIKKTNGKHNLNSDDVEMSLHLFDIKMYNFFNEELNLHSYFSSTHIDGKVLLDMSSHPLTRHAVGKIEDKVHVNYFTMYYLDKLKVMKPKHILGYVILNNKYTDTIVKYPSNKKPEQKNFKFKDYVFEEPSWDSKATVLRENSELKLNLVDAHVYNENEGYEFVELKNNWIGLMIDNKKYWMHVSQFASVDFIDKFFEDNSISEVNLNEIYKTANGKKIDPALAAKLASSVHVRKTKWVNNELWFNVDFLHNPLVETEEDIKKDQESIEVKDLWVRPYDGEKKNYRYNSMGC